MDDACNFTQVNNTFSPHVTRSATAKTCLYTFFTLIFIVGTIGNIFVIYAIGIKKKVTRSFNLHIISLSVADLYVSIFLPIVTIHDLITNLKSWQLGTIACKILPAMNHTAVLVSSFMLVIISISRLRVIKCSTTIHITKKRCLLEIFIAWLASFIVVSPYMLASTYNKCTKTCHDDWHSTDIHKDSVQRLIYFAAYEGIACFIPVIIMIIVYTQSILLLKKKQVPGNHELLEKKRKQKNLQIIKMFGLIVSVFFGLTTPYMISVFIAIYYMAFQLDFYVRHEELFFNLTYALYTLAGFNCCINPFIYAGMHNDVRKLLRRKNRRSRLLSESSLCDMPRRSSVEHNNTT